jgi:hypothetical protein
MEDQPQPVPLQWRLFSFVLVLGSAGLSYIFLKRHDLFDSAGLYLGLPLLLALGLSLTPKTRSAMGATMKGITIALLLSAVVFQEGSICILFAAPLFYGVGALIASLVDSSRRRNDRDSKLRVACVSAIVGLLALEGTTPFTSFGRHNEVVVTKIIHAKPAEIRAQLSQMPSLGLDRPSFLKIFPYPAQTTPLGLNVGDESTIKFTAFKHIWWTKVEGSLILKVVGSAPNHIQFAAIRDDSYLSHYMKWNSSEILMEPVDNENTSVTWKLSYERILDPSWYFGPLQNYAANLAAEELIDHVATPHS